MLKNVRLEYLYRDGDNYKNWGAVRFANPDGLSLEEAEQRLRDKFQDRDYFIAEQIGLESRFLWNAEQDYDPDDNETWPDDVGPGNYVINEADHCYHEFFGLSETDEWASEPLTLLQFVIKVEQVTNWNVFEPTRKEMTT